MNTSSWSWTREHKWRLLLVSPIPEIYDRQDNVITPPTAVVFLAVILGTVERKGTIWLLPAVTLVWLVISVATEGSGLFTVPGRLAPLLFMVLLVTIFILPTRWLVRAVHINAEVLCAAAVISCSEFCGRAFTPWRKR